MRWLRLVRAELRKLSTTKLPWGFLAVLVFIAGLDAAVVMWGTDMDGSKGFIATADDQQSLMAFATNTMIGTSMFGAIAAAREYGHNTVVPTFLTSPRRHRAVLAQLTAIMLAGGLLGLVGQILVIGGVAGALPFTDYGFMASTGGVTRLLVASAWAGAVGAALGAGLGILVRNIGGAVTAVVVLLFIVPPLAVQLFSDAASWIPDTLNRVVGGVGGQVSLPAALAALTLWALIPAALGLLAVQRRDVV
jgi:ABC-2 type transport system permease protein